MVSAPVTVFHPSEKQKPVIKRRCCCWSCLSCSIFTFVFLLLVALLLGFLVPRIPEYEILDVILTAPPVVRSESNPFGFSSQAKARVVVDNKNWIDWTFKSIDTVILDAESRVEVGGSYVEDQGIEKRSVQEMYLPLNLTYVGANKTDPITLRYIGMCLPPPGKPMHFKAVSTFRLRGLSSYKITREKEVVMKCPSPAKAPSASGSAAPSAATPAATTSGASATPGAAATTPTPVA
ncbi:hypothetical protein BDF22DRAFT_686663 [Syncephalis plumigaleata]|nr:hypothetical protein BDF22DRAFT_686663 [Syncephalis plumigaleata]